MEDNWKAFDEVRLAKLEAKAAEGNVTAMQILQKMERQKQLEAKKQELMGQSTFSRPEDENQEAAKTAPAMPNVRGVPAKLDELDILEIEKYIQKGEFRALPEHMAVYLKWMEIAHDWYYKFKSRNWVMRYLLGVCRDVDGNAISYYMAEKIFNDMLSFFYADKDFKKNSWLRYLAERTEMMATLALEDNDFETAGKNMERAAKIMDMIKTEKKNIDPRLLDRRPRFFMTSAKELGIPEINRYELARQIDDMELTEKEKLKVKQDLGVEDRDMLEE